MPCKASGGLLKERFFFEKHITHVDTYTRTSTRLYEYAYAHSTYMSTSERLSRLDIRDS
jgi:hypothetical protein